ncbi:BTB/POZ domain-containing protein KCTD6 [Elysia marginata]|uniref:BTB/POZ domain-containing protein KCTD6 n=1 Tax=Elysia marginata TaxID=1093978 RepID=A0AAV4JCE9_9GAST|nr:BTB/POZ domain-containing protein KCTD6 [Elysia marginata]
MDSVITLNVGGTLYTTTRATLLKYPDSMLGSLVSNDYASTLDPNGHLFIDRDGEAFKYILNFLRSSQLCVPSDFANIDLLAAEADFYQVIPLIDAIKGYQEEKARHKCRLYFLEIVEVRTGSLAVMPTCNSRVKVMMIGRKDVLKTLPLTVTGIDFNERLCYSEPTDYAEFELFGPSSRQRVGEELANLGWTLVSSNLSSSSGIDTRNQGAVHFYLEHTFRDRWSQSLEPGHLVQPNQKHEKEQLHLNNSHSYTSHAHVPQ